MPQAHYIFLPLLILDIWQLQIIEDGPCSSLLSVYPYSVIWIAEAAVSFSLIALSAGSVDLS